MNITIFNVTAKFSCDGSRLISAILKRAGHSVNSVFLARMIPMPYDEQEFESLRELLKSTDIVMMSIYSPYAIRAVQLTMFIRKNFSDMKVIWGGPHCVSAPELSLSHADGVCFSEGDEAVLQFVERMESGGDWSTTPNFAFNEVNGKIKRNELHAPFKDLDSLPYFDFDFDTHYLLDQGLFPMTKEIFKERCAKYPFSAPAFTTITSRGCPFACTFCNNIRYQNMYGYNPMRFQSVARFLDEMEHHINKLGLFECVLFGDDDFIIRPQKQIEEFAKNYKKRIGLPFAIEMSANAYRKEKLEILLDAGLKIVQIGVQSGSQRVLDEVFVRRIKVAKTKEVISMLKPYHKSMGLDLLVDFIIDNPYETMEDIVESYRHIVGLPEGAKVNIFCLAFYPGTPLYERALSDGFVATYKVEEFRRFAENHIRYQKNYETFLILFDKLLRKKLGRFYYKVPRVIMHLLGSDIIRKIAAVFPESLYERMIRVVK